MSEDWIRVGVNGYGGIGKRVADAGRLQDDMKLVGEDYELQCPPDGGASWRAIGVRS
ncbi:MAG: hypothetical protein HKN03_06120 [Acidimicrobiales bacterium]|nr:hypothetical protein [Acidimicrobiales bacterium]